MKRIIVVVLICAGWWYYHRPAPVEELPDRTARIIVGDGHGGEQVVWERAQ